VISVRLETYDARTAFLPMDRLVITEIPYRLAVLVLRVDWWTDLRVFLTAAHVREVTR